MAEIIGIHGILNHLRGEESLAREWGPALRDGLRRAGYKREVSVDCTFYGDLFRRQGTMAGGLPPLSAQDITSEWEQDMLLAWWQAASESDPRRVSRLDAKTMVRTPQFVQRALNQLVKARFFQGWGGERVLIFGLKQVYRYLHDETIRAQAQERLRASIDSDTRVIVAHSLGSIVAYEGLCAHQDWHITTFVSLGSPLGIATLIFDRLKPPPENGLGVWPRVEHWYNIADEGDIVPLVKNLSTRFGERVINVRVHNGWQSHNVLHYLTAKETGEAIKSGL
jgi:hypothetical protein